MNKRVGGVLFDSDGVVALVNEEHGNHLRAIKSQKQLDSVGAMWYISRYVIAESATVLSQRADHATAVQFLKEVKDWPGLHIIETTEEIELAVEEIFERQTSKNISYIDCHNIALVRHLKLDGVFSFDTHYRKNGIALMTDN